MKKLICFIITAALLLSSTSIAFAKSDNAKNNKQNTKQTVQQNAKQNSKKEYITKSEKDTKKEIKNEVKNVVSKEIVKATEQVTIEVKQAAQKQNQKIKAKKQEFKINGSPVIKYGYFKLPIRPVTKGMGAEVAFNKESAVLTVTKGTTIIVIDFKNKTVTVNGVADTKSGLFTAKNDKKMTVLIKYIAKTLGIRVDVDKDEVEVEVPGLDLPTEVKVTVEGTAGKENTLNTSSLALTASAKIKAGQATGGKAELYVGDKLVATDAVIVAADTTVTFTTSDGTPTHDELKAIVPVGGVVTVKLYNADNKFVVSTVANPTLFVDYSAPTITGVNSAVYSVSGAAFTINVTGAGANGDVVDVTKISVYNAITGGTYFLTNAAETGSTGLVNSENTVIIKLGSTDKLALTGISGSSLLLNLALGSLITDAAGNTSLSLPAVQMVPLTIAE